MRALLWALVLMWALPNPGFTQEVNPPEVSEEFTYVLSDFKVSSLLSVKLVEQDKLKMSVLNDESHEHYIKTLVFNLEGKLLSESQIDIEPATQIKVFDIGLETYAGWIRWDGKDPCQFWLAKLEGDAWRQKKLLENPGEFYGKWWLLEAGGQKKLFILSHTSRKVEYSDHDDDILYSYWLNGYAFNDEDLTLEGKMPVELDDLNPRNFECAVMNDQVCIWNTCGRKGSPVETLQVAFWNKGGDLDWTECYTGNRPLLFEVDPQAGSAVFVYEAKNPSNFDAVGISSLVGTERTIPIFRPYHQYGKNKLLCADGGACSWLMTSSNLTEKRTDLVVFDQQLRSHSYTMSFPFNVRYAQSDINKNDVWTVSLIDTYDPQARNVLYDPQARRVLKVQKLSLPEPEPSPSDEKAIAMSFFGVDPDSLESTYKSYAEGEGAELFKADDEQLINDILNGSMFSALISYHRLWIRDEPQAEMCLAERLANYCSKVAKEESEVSFNKPFRVFRGEWIFYGESALKPIVKIAQTGTAKQRWVALRGLSECGEPSFVKEAVRFLGNPEMEMDNPTYLGLCRGAIGAGYPVGVDYLIRAASIVLNDQTPLNELSLCNNARNRLKEFGRLYDDAPQGWSATDWHNWWGKHRASFEAVELTVSEKSDRAYMRQFQELFREVARKMENIR